MVRAIPSLSTFSKVVRQRIPFLGVPNRGLDQAVSSTYLSEKEGGMEFTSEDEATVRAEEGVFDPSVGREFTVLISATLCYG